MNKFINLIQQSKYRFSDAVAMFLCLGLLAYVGYKLPPVLRSLYLAKDSESFQAVILSLLVLYLAQYFLRVFFQLLMSILSRRAIAALRDDLFTHWLMDRSSWKGDVTIDKYSAGEVQSRILSDTNALKESVDNASVTIVFDFVLVASCLVSFLILDFKIGISFFLAQILVIALLMFISKKLGPVFHAVRRVHAILSKEVTDILKGLHQIFKLEQYDYALTRLKPVQKDYLKVQLHANLFDASYFAFAESLFPLFLAFLVLVFPMDIGKNVALLAVLIDLIQRSVMPMKDMANKISTLQRVFTGLDRVNEFRSVLHSIDMEKIHASYITSDEGELYSVEIHIAPFHYDLKEKYYEDTHRKVFSLRPVSLTLKHGMSLGIAGKTGAGKSTLVKILTLQLYSPETWISLHRSNIHKEIFFKNRDDLIYFAGLISIVSQESHIFSTTVFYNISLSDTLLPDFMNYWNKMISTIPYLSEWGIRPEDRISSKNLSYGQRQLLSALRAVYLKRPIIIFDEISAGMDKALEESLYALLQLMTRECMTIVVAHRLETIKRCNNILLMDNGECIDRGTHDELLQKSSLYREYLAESHE